METPAFASRRLSSPARYTLTPGASGWRNLEVQDSGAHPPAPTLLPQASPEQLFVPPRPPSRLLAFPPLSKSFHPLLLLLPEEADGRTLLPGDLRGVGCGGTAGGYWAAPRLAVGRRRSLDSFGAAPGLPPPCPGFPGCSEAGPARVSSNLSPCPSPLLSLQPQRPGVRLSPLLQKLPDFFLLILHSLPLL